jgi:hypothetical protein
MADWDAETKDLLACLARAPAPEPPMQPVLALHRPIAAPQAGHKQDQTGRPGGPGASIRQDAEQ